MANHKSAVKRHRQTLVRTARNRSRRSRVRTFIRRVEDAVASRDIDKAEQALRLAQPELHRGVSKGVFHWRTMARKLSRLAGRVNGLRAGRSG